MTGIILAWIFSVEIQQGQAMARRKHSGFELIASLPWPVGFALGIIAFADIRYGMGWYLSASHNMYLKPLGKVASSGAATPLAWLVLAIFWVAALCSFIGRRHRSRLLETQSGLDSLRAMSWRQFEMLVGEAFRRQGYRVEETGLGGADGGIDLRLSKDGKTTLIQCKQWRSRRVDVKVVREMYGLLVHHGADAIKIVAIGSFTPDAERFVQDKPIELIHGDALLVMIRTVQDTQVAIAPAPANADPEPSHDTVPECPNCGVPMVTRTNRRTREAFWGCPKYPGCRGTRHA